MDATIAEPEAATAGNLMEATDVWKSYRRGWASRRSVTVLRGATIALGRGEVVGLVGENGSGKSTLLKILVGDLAADSGTLARHSTFGYCPQTPVVYERLTCREHFALFGSSYGLSEGEIVVESERLYEELDFQRFADVRVGELSGGTRSKLNLSLALLHRPELLFLDEPYAGFDWDTYQRFWSLAAERSAGGASVLIVSHFLADQERFDRIYDLADGRTAER